MDAKHSAYLKAATDAMRNGPDDQVITTPDGAKLRVRRAPEPGVLARVESLETHDAVRCVTWAPSATAPIGYPERFPFLAGRASTSSEANGNVTMQWYDASVTDVDLIVSALVASGWTETTIPSPSMPGMVIRPFRRDARQRIVLFGAGFLSVLETRAE